MIILIDNYDSFTYNLYQMLAIHTQVKVFRNDELTLEEIASLKPQGIVISPGPKTPKDAGICLELIKKFHKEIPILGVCLGHQSIAESFGGQVVHAGSIVHGKPASIFHNRKDLFEKMPLPFEAGRYHSLIVEKESLPKCFLIEAETEDGVIMGMKHVEYPLYGLQFHPESILTPQGKILIEAFLKICGVL
ncbi:MAG: aminodeoxychorismate/anthranilate synthase component II [Chlamydiales bacterium]|nr:aminodeoxychorismate/anthranilate synthase component II [Chlamydiia bacterium]MCP5504635.1 aminodeoxychorismate/anthranilate synthase component II [Chlamydiales bacterium]